MRPAAVAKAWRDPAIVAFCACLLVLPFIGKAYHIDEPYFLAIARQILRDPFHPFAFEWNWDNKLLPARAIQNTPPLMPYLLALVLKASGGAEWSTRLLFIPFDVLSALSLYFLAKRFLARPLLPVLIVIAGPAFFINLDHIMAEKLTACLGFAGLWALVAGRFWSSAALLGLSIITKYNAVLFLPAAAAYSLSCGVSRRRVAGYAALAMAPLAAYLLSDRMTGGATALDVWTLMARSQSAWWSTGAYKLRSFFAFAGGCGVVGVFWPFLAWRRDAAAAAASAIAAVLLFLPFFDLGPVRGLDRAAGALYSAGAIFFFTRLLSAQSRRVEGWTLWAPWALSASAVSFFYWSVVSRMLLFMIPPAVFLMAGVLEKSWEPAPLRRLYAASLACVLALGLALAAVDYRYAAAQREVARTYAAAYRARGKKVWFAAHWGLQYYLEEQGAVGLDWSKGGWEQAAAGDVIVVPRVNTRAFPPRKRLLADVRTLTVDEAIPLRVMSGWDGQAGFYSNAWGFLPYSLSREPLDEFSFIELL